MGVSGLFLLLALAAAQPVTEVEVRLPAEADAALLKDIPGLIAVPRGQPLSARAVRRSIERLMQTGRFSAIEVVAEERAGSVAVIFELTPSLRIGDVYVEGAKALGVSDVLAASKLLPDSELWTERLLDARENVRQAYRRKGYQAAQVELKVTEGERGLDVGLIVTEGAPTRLSRLVVRGDSGFDEARLMQELSLAKGEVIDLDAVSRGLDALRETYRKEGFWRARVEQPIVEQGGTLVLPIAAGPKLKLTFRGNRVFADTALESVVDWDGNEPLEATVEERLAARIENFYLFRGYHDVRVRVLERLSPSGRSGNVEFVIDEGEPLRVDDVQIAGAEGIKPAELKALLHEVIRSQTSSGGTEAHALADPLSLEGRTQRPAFAEFPAPPAELVLVESAYLDAMRSMTALYRERGYLAAKVSLEEVTISQGAARVRYLVVEGPKTVLRKFDFRGGPEKFPDRAAQPFRAGDPFSERMLERWQKSLERELSKQGYLFARVAASWELTPPGTDADVLFEITTGPQVKLGKVFVKGIARTDEPVVRNQVALKEGEPIDPDQIFTTQRNLVALGIFRQVDVRMLSPEAVEGTKDLLVEVTERPRLDGEFGLGYFLAEGPRFVVEALAANVGGKAINVGARGRLNFFGVSAPALSRQIDVSDLNALEQIGGRGNLSVSNRGILPLDIGARLDLIGERVFRQSYRFTRVALVPALDWSIGFYVPKLEWARPKLTLQLQYEVEYARVFSVNNPSGVTFPLLRADQERLRFLFGTFALQSIRFAPTLDLRDDAVVPRKGILLQTAAEAVFDIFTRDEREQYVPVRFLKLNGTLTGYIPLPRKAVLALSARAGRIFPLVQGSVTPPVKRFFVGGAASLRGFREDALIAEDQRKDYERQVRDCQALVTPFGCSDAARSILSGTEIASQGGELYALGKAELRFPVVGDFDLGLFVEAGNLWLGQPTAFALRPVAGSGVRYVTPIGPLALDIGFNLLPDALVNEPAFNVHFNIGLF